MASVTSPCLYLGLAIAYVVVTFLFIVATVSSSWPSWVKWFLLALVLIGPPGWFFYQFQGLPDSSFDDRFKYNQDLASKIWAAVSAFALAIAFKKEV